MQKNEMSKPLKMIIFLIITAAPGYLNNPYIVTACAIGALLMYYFSEKDNDKLKNELLQVKGLSNIVNSELHNIKKENKNLELREKANKIAGHFRGDIGNYLDSNLKSNSAYLQTIVKNLSVAEIKTLLDIGFFDKEGYEVLTKYLMENHEPNRNS